MSLEFLMQAVVGLTLLAPLGVPWLAFTTLPQIVLAVLVGLLCAPLVLAGQHVRIH